MSQVFTRLLSVIGALAVSSCILLSAAPAHAVDPDMELVFRITTASRSISLPLTGFTGTVNWGDGTTNTSLSHTYADPVTPTDVTVTVDGSATRFGNASGWTGNTILRAMNHWNGLGLTSLQGAFTDCDDLQSVPSALPPSVTNLSYLFIFSAANPVQVESWTTSSVTDMSNAFNTAPNFNRNISGWDTSNVTNMRGMFGDASHFNQNIGGWNISNVQNMNSLFLQATDFNQDLSLWNFGNVLSMVTPLNQSGISPTNLTKLLISLSSQNVSANQLFDGSGLTYYSSADSAVQYLRSAPRNWTISATSLPMLTPTINTAPTATSVTSGQSVSHSTLGGGGTSTAGTFAFTNPNTVIAQGSNTVNVTFTPDNEYAYNPVVFTVTVTGAAVPTPTPSPSSSSSSNPAASSLASTGFNGSGILGGAWLIISIGALFLMLRKRSPQI